MLTFKLLPSTLRLHNIRQRIGPSCLSVAQKISNSMKRLKSTAETNLGPTKSDPGNL